MSTRSGPARPSPEAVPPGERGATRIADRVVAKIAARAAREALAPLPKGAVPPHATVAVRARDHGRHGRGHEPGEPVATARVRIALDLGYPGDIGARCGAVRRQVIERVGALANMAVPEVVVQVERLCPAPAAREPYGRTP